MPAKDVYSVYFKIECQRKTNLACRLGQIRRKYDTKEMLRSIFEYTERFPGYTPFWLQAALIADEDVNHMYGASEYYERYLKEEQKFGKIETPEFLGYTWYRLGRFYEKVKDQKKKAARFYINAYECAPHNYRFTYKVAFMNEIQGKKKHAIFYYDKLIKQLMPYITGNYLTTCKSEYAFKVAIKLLNLYKSEMQYKIAGSMVDRAISIRESIDSNRFFKQFYPLDKVPDIREGMKERLKISWLIEEKGQINDLITKYF